jgi:hypothetical protein
VLAVLLLGGLVGLVGAAAYVFRRAPPTPGASAAAAAAVTSLGSGASNSERQALVRSGGKARARESTRALARSRLHCVACGR